MSGLNLLNFVANQHGDLTDRLYWLKKYLAPRKNQDGSITLAPAEARLVENVLSGRQRLVLDDTGQPLLA